MGTSRFPSFSQLVMEKLKFCQERQWESRMDVEGGQEWVLTLALPFTQFTLDEVEFT